MFLVGIAGTAGATPAGTQKAGTAAKAPARAASVQFQYQIAVHTGTVPGAGTDGDVWLWLRGTYGDSGWLYLDNSDDNFENNDTDYFNYTLADLGTITDAFVYFRPGGFGPDWYLDTVSVSGAGATVTFPANRWFSSEGMTHLTP